MIRTGNAPCKDCPDRFVGCHSTCQKYVQYRTDRDDMIKKMYEYKEGVRYTSHKALMLMNRNLKRKR